MIGWKIAEAAGSDQVRSHFLFRVPVSSEAEQHVKRFRDPLALDIFRKLANRLRAQGFDVSQAKSGSACDAIFTTRFSEFRVIAIILAKRSVGVVECDVLTWCLRPFWRHVIPQVVSESWIRTCSAMEQILRENPSITSLQRLSENEAEASLIVAHEVASPSGPNHKRRLHQ